MAEKTKDINEQKTTAANYILNFYNEVAQLTHHYANYENLMLELAEKYGDHQDKIEDGEKEIIRQTCHTLRYFVTATYIKYQSILSKVGDPNPDITTLYNRLKLQFIVKREDVRNYTILLNSVLVNTVIKDLLQTSSEIINKIYGEQ